MLTDDVDSIVSYTCWTRITTRRMVQHLKKDIRSFGYIHHAQLAMHVELQPLIEGSHLTCLRLSGKCANGLLTLTPTLVL